MKVVNVGITKEGRFPRRMEAGPTKEKAIGTSVKGQME